MRRLLAGVLVAVCGLTALNLVQDISNRHAIEKDLSSRSGRALTAAGITADVAFRGRDGAVTVQSAADEERAKKIVEDQAGVRVVQVTAPAAPAAHVRITVDAGAVSADGSVPSQAVKSALGGKDQLAVDPQLAGDGVENLPAVVTALGKDATDVVVDLSDGKLTLTGTVSSAAVKDAAGAAAQKVTTTVANQLQVKEPKPEVQTQLNSLPQVTFANNSATLTAQGRQVVSRIAGLLKANPDVKVSIEGHTDANGKPAANLALSKARAQTVRNGLIAAGIAADRLTATGFGATRPKVPDTSAANRAINRRVELIVSRG